MNKDSAVLVLREMNLCGLVVNRSNNKSVGQDADGISGRSLYCLMEKVFRFIYLKNMGRVCGGIWLASCRRSVCACVGGSSTGQSRAWFGWEAELG